jgi:hypothetical protein
LPPSQGGNRASSGVTEKVCVSVRPVIEGAGRAAGDLVQKLPLAQPTRSW